ncbi:MAG: hypothetical protein WEA31_05220, partial [Pirellulales bacterium]
VIKQPMALGAIVSGLFITIILLSLALWKVPEWRPDAPVVQQPSTEFVARIASNSQAAFDDSSDGNFKNRDLFDDDTIVLTSGLVVIEYDTGARVVLEGPATYQVQGVNGGDLRVGKLVARADTAASHGFAIEIPGARVVDLGTEFGLEVTADGSSNVAVLSGEIDLTGAGEQSGVRLAAGQAATVEARTGRITHRDVKQAQFAQALIAGLERMGQPPIIVGGTAERLQRRSSTTNKIASFRVARGDHRKLVLAASWESSDASISATWKGSEVFLAAVNSDGGRNSAILYLDDPTPGTGDIVVTFGSATRSRVGVVSLYNTAAGVDVTSSGTGSTGSLTTTEPGSLVIGVYTTNDPNGRVQGPFSQTLYNGDAGSCRGDAGCEHEATAGVRDYNWNADNSSGDNHVLAAFVGTAVVAP